MGSLLLMVSLLHQLTHMPEQDDIDPANQPGMRTFLLLK